MDKTGIIVISLCGALLVWWFVEQKKVADQQAQYAAAHPVAVAAAGTNEPPTLTTAVTTPAPVIVFDTNAPEQMLVLTNGRARYTFTSRGGGLKQIELLDYPQTVSARWKDSVTNAAAAVTTLNARTTVPALAILGGESLIGDHFDSNRRWCARGKIFFQRLASREKFPVQFQFSRERNGSH